MDTCELYEALEQLGASSASEEAIAAFMDETLSAWGFDAVPVSFGALEDALASYDPTTGSITIDPEFLSTALEVNDYEAVLTTLIHEAMHAAADQAGIDFESIQEEEGWAYEGSSALTEEALSNCTSEPAESGAPPNLPDSPWSSI